MTTTNKSKMRLKSKILLTGICSGLMVFGFNCEHNRFESSSSSSNTAGTASSASTGGVNDPNPSPVLQNLQFSVLSGEQVFGSFLSVTGQKTAIASMTAEYNRRIGTFATEPQLGVINSPMLLAVTSLGGEVCNEFVRLEQAKAAADRTYLGPVNFGGALSTLTEAQYDTVTMSLAKSFWNRDLTTEEKTMFRNFRKDFATTVPTAEMTNTKHTRALILSTCSAFLSSLEVYTY